MLNTPKIAQLRGLYVLTDEKLGGGHYSIARAALKGGARIIQLRDKTTPPREILAIARAIRRLTRDFNALFFVNDALDLALLANADGVHLGPDDFSVQDVRAVVKADFLIGASCGTPTEAIQAEKNGANMVGIGAVFNTQTKSDAGTAIGIEGLKSVLRATTLPGAAIGGINARNLQSVLNSGVPMACVISAITGAGDESAMELATRELVSLFEIAGYH